MAEPLLVYIPIPSATVQAWEEIPKQLGCQNWQGHCCILLQGAAEETRPHSPSHGGSSLIPFTWKLAVLLGSGLKSHNRICFLIRNLLAPQLQTTSC